MRINAIYKAKFSTILYMSYLKLMSFLYCCYMLQNQEKYVCNYSIIVMMVYFSLFAFTILVTNSDPHTFTFIFHRVRVKVQVLLSLVCLYISKKEF